MDLPEDMSVENVVGALMTIEIPAIRSEYAHRECEEERALMAAVIELAFFDLIRFKNSKSYSSHTHYLDAKSYFDSDDRSYTFSFINLCRILLLDPDSIREQIRKKLPKYDKKHHYVKSSVYRDKTDLSSHIERSAMAA